MARRRGKGEGTTFKRKDGTWQGAVTIGYDDNGKQRRKTVYGKTQAEVRKKIDELKHQLAGGIFTDTKLTVKEYLERWLAEKTRQVKPRTAELYREQAKRYIYPRIGREEIAKLSPLHLQAMLGDIADHVGVPTANKVRRLLFGAFKQAVRWQLLPRNVCEAVDPMKEAGYEMKLWTPVEALRFLEAVKDHRLYAAFYVLMAAGLRRGEVLGLKWEDLKGNRLYIRRTLTIVDSKPAWSTPKTEHGTRFVTLPADALEVLEGHRKRQQAEKDYLGECWTETGLMFTREDGRLLSPQTFLKIWNRLQEKAGVPHIRLHDLRHMHVSLLVKQGLDPRTIADRVGHSDPAFTLRRYSHMFEEQRRAAAIDLKDLLNDGKLGGEEDEL